MTTVNTKAHPLAEDDLSQKIFTTIQMLNDTNNIKIGANESVKCLNKGRAHLIVLAGDCEPFEISQHIPLICEDKNVPYVYIKSKSTLGKACNVSRSVIACAVFSDTESGCSRCEKFVKDIVKDIRL
ncbi:ribosomal protein L7A [Hamiltosporidium tvaerminnensis]|uniref:H/ACA ribonucleoprotein complex subunit 2 n=2 Tax=Hamiltosporidium TaxID=1176354 RepID=A0A4Q9KR55_9MICR|nr:ribosomal protein L7A [Hamiltosporidium tvaerminnensis]TBT97153.1 ribosomal protein L30 [Hamiltosporidium magnivora]TBT98607.1 ribosomal protein L7A [Hamiltosporidium magnivora]TBU21043.1 ribosomal protein L7A [Hamiltosporidium tvaerminnensis]